VFFHCEDWQFMLLETVPSCGRVPQRPGVWGPTRFEAIINIETLELSDKRRNMKAASGRKSRGAEKKHLTRMLNGKGVFYLASEDKKSGRRYRKGNGKTRMKVSK